MAAINIPSFSSLVSREHRIHALQELYSNMKDVMKTVAESSGGTAEAQEKSNETTADGTTGTVTIESNVYTKVTGLDSLSSDTTVTFKLGALTDNMQNLYEGSFSTGSDITSTGKKLTIKWPTDINWGNSDLSISANTHYEFSIRYESGKYYGIIHSWNIQS